MATKAEANFMQTYRGVADAWECDQMQHMNVRFIADRFSRADGFLFASLGRDQMAASPPHPEEERLVFRKEILPGEPLSIESTCFAVSGSSSFWVRHALKCVASDVINATATTRYYLDIGPSTFGLHPAVSIHGDGTTIEDAMTKPVVVADPLVPLSESGRIFLTMADYSGGALGRETIVRLINHAASCAGIHRGRCRPGDGQSGIGSATLEIQLKRSVQCTPTMSVLVMSGMKARSAKTVTIFHRIIDAGTSNLIAEAASVHVFFDITSRIAIPIPAEVSPTVFWG